MTSFFGGDYTMSHFSVRQPYFVYDPKVPFKKGLDAKIAFNKKRDEDRAKLKAMGWKEAYFQFKTKDKVAEAKAKAEAEKHAAEWEKKSGLKLEVSLGFFL